MIQLVPLRDHPSLIQLGPLQSVTDHLQGQHNRLFTNHLWVNYAGSGINEDDKIDASESDSDMEMHSADESTEMQELCYDICAEYLPECGLGGETD